MKALQVTDVNQGRPQGWAARIGRGLDLDHVASHGALAWMFSVAIGTVAADGVYEHGAETATRAADGCLSWSF